MICGVCSSKKPVENQLNLWQPGGDKCGCFNIVNVRRSNVHDKCHTKDFLHQNIERALKKNGAPYQCNFDSFRTRVDNMKRLTLQLVDAFFSCKLADCTPKLMKVYNNYVDYRIKEFNPFIQCVYTNFNTDCAQVLIHARQPAYSSIEKVFVELLSCARLKLAASKDAVQEIAKISIPPPTNEIECNCLKIDPRPIPKSKCDCYSNDERKIKKFVDVNFGRVYSEYDTNSSDCNYSQFYGQVHKLHVVISEATNLFDPERDPTMDDVAKIYATYVEMLSKYNAAVREYAVNNDPSYSLSISKARTNPLAIADSVLGILTQCVGYVDESKDTCSQYKC